MSLRLSASINLPGETVSRTLGIIAQKGSGKTYTAMLLAEQMLAAKQQIVCLDPTGVWWGPRSSRDGKSAGLPILVMGGEHGDIPLDLP